MKKANVSLSFICGATWEDMLPVENGRFCTGCHKTVVDFVGKSDTEISHFLSQQTAPICGRFKEEQVEFKHPLSFPPTHLWKNIAAGLLMTTAFSGCIAIGSPALKPDSTPEAINVQTSISTKKQEEGLPVTLPIDGIDEIMPIPIGGIEGMQARAINPDNSVGRVILQFTVTEEGKVENPHILTASPEVSEAAKAVALKVLQETNFKPAKQDGKPIKVKMSLPIRFRD